LIFLDGMLILNKGWQRKFRPIVATIAFRPQNLHALDCDTEATVKSIRFSKHVVQAM
jgi:hypothetical protein